MYTKTLILFLTLALLLLSPSQAQSILDRGAGFSFSRSMGMTRTELSTLFREDTEARGWKYVALGPDETGVRIDVVLWGFIGEDKKWMWYKLRNGHVVQIVSSENLYSASMTERILNRMLVAINDHEWVDPAGHTRWKLTLMPDEGRCQVEVNPYNPKRK